MNAIRENYLKRIEIFPKVYNIDLVCFHAICAICGASMFTTECMLAFRLLPWMVLTRMVKKTYSKMSFTIFLRCVFIFSLSVFTKGCVHGGIQGAHMEGAHM